MADTLADSATGHDAGIVRIHGTRKALAVTSDCTPRYVEADPYEGGKQAVAEAWRNLIAVGAEPIAITDNLNFGNPEKPDIMGQIVRAIDGMSEACHVLSFPVVSGNVSLYNETQGKAIQPTPTVGAVGLIPDYDSVIGYRALQDGAILAVIGTTRGEVGASLMLREVYKQENGAPPPVDLETELQNGTFIRELIAQKRLLAVHDLSDGGLLCAASEMAMASQCGMRLKNPTSLPDHIAAFAEDQGRYLIAFDKINIDFITNSAAKSNIDWAIIGEAGGDRIEWGPDSFLIEALKTRHEAWMPAFMASKG